MPVVKSVGAILLMLAAAVPAPAQDELRAELQTATQRLRALKSYSFRVRHAIDTNLPLPARDVNGDGRYVESVGFHIKGGNLEMFRKNKKTTYQDADGTWQILGSGGGGGPGNNTAFLAAQVREPHVEVGSAHSDIDRLEVEDSTQDIDGTDCAVFKGKLTADAARKFTSWADAYGSAVGGAKREGAVKIWVDDAWTIRKYELVSRIEGSVPFNPNAFAQVTTTVTLSEQNATELEPPSRALDLLEGKK
jgi:hypothetical protein